MIVPLTKSGENQNSNNKISTNNNETFKIDLNKIAKEFNWNERPLSKLQKYFALRHTAHTIKLNSLLEEKLKQKFEHSCKLKLSIGNYNKNKFSYKI